MLNQPEIEDQEQGYVVISTKEQYQCIPEKEEAINMLKNNKAPGAEQLKKGRGTDHKWYVGIN